ncbi:hypothetical protein [Aeoliella sp. SH292]|uniref:hypothetical protein n=1 Tax=Aeoliella sp. SH292 TaxID=3454464 RepID=UPI003F94809D
MSTEAQNLIANFQALPLAEQQYVAEAIIRQSHDSVADEDLTTGEPLTSEELIKRFHAWAYSHPAIRNPNLDDSREAMYEGCGE